MHEVTMNRQRLETFTRRADLTLALTLAAGVLGLVGCRDSTAPLRSRSIVADAQAANATTSWVNSGGSYCLSVLSQDGTTFPKNSAGQTGWYYCPYQSTSFSSPDGYASLYLAHDPLNPGFSLTQEGISVVRGPIVPTSYNPDGTIATFTRTDSLTCDNGGSQVPTWTGTTTQNFQRKAYRCCTRFSCHICTTDVVTGGAGTLTANQPPPPPPPPPGPPAAVVVSPDSATTMVSQTVQLTATVVDSTGTPTAGPAVTWAASDTTVATVSASGLVTGVAVGGVTITATSGSLTGVAAVTVTPEGTETKARPVSPVATSRTHRRR
jgi:hypothetical protein